MKTENFYVKKISIKSILVIPLSSNVSYRQGKTFQELCNILNSLNIYEGYMFLNNILVFDDEECRYHMNSFKKNERDFFYFDKNYDLPLNLKNMVSEETSVFFNEYPEYQIS